MLKKLIKYTDYNGFEREEYFYFNLTKAEVTEMELSVDGGLTKIIEKIVGEKDTKRLIELFKELILKAYGEKSPDGKVFIKNAEVRERFSCTEAYSELFMELATDAKAAENFVNAILPKLPTPPPNN